MKFGNNDVSWREVVDGELTKETLMDPVFYRELVREFEPYFLLLFLLVATLGLLRNLLARGV